MDWCDKPRTIQVLVDNDSWILPYVYRLVAEINRAGDHCCLRRHVDEVEEGDVLFLLGCINLVPSDVLNRNSRNLVVHESALPKGRGFAPISWQVLEGATEIQVCLLHAAEEADAGDVLLRRTLFLQGTELCDELRRLQGQTTLQICLDYLNAEVEPQSIPQTGTVTTYQRRRPADSQLNANQSIADQFDLLRICDNERYPAWFDYRGKRFQLQITEQPFDVTNQSPISEPTSDPLMRRDTNTYLVAGCKSWNRASFDQNASCLPGTWHYTDDAKGLSATIERLQPSKVFFLHWSWLVPKETLDQTECICFHMTDLPYGRGGSPLQNLIVRGHQETKLTALRMTEVLDAGPIFLKEDLSLNGTAAEILARASNLSFAMIDRIIREDIQPTPQTGDVVSFQRRTPDHSAIPGNSTMDEIFDHIRMLDGEGYPPAYIDSGHFRVEFTSAKNLEDRVEAKATISDRRLDKKRRSA